MATVAPADAELVRLGDCYCLFSPETHAVALLNASGAAMAASLLGMRGPRPAVPFDATQGAQLEAVRGALDDAGFFAKLRGGGGAGAADRATARAEPRPSGARATGEVGTWQAPGGRPVALSVDEPGLARLIVQTLAPLAAREAAGRPLAASIAVCGCDDGFAVSRDGVRIVGGLAPGEARRIALQALLMASLDADRVATILHASAVAIGDGAVLLAGATGSGKSTLTVQLVADGAHYLADDLVPLAATGTCVSAFPVAVSVKEGSWPHVGALMPALLSEPVHEIGARRVRYVPLEARALSSEARAWRVGTLVFPSYVAGRALSVVRLAPEEALARLLESGTEIVGHPRTIRPLVRLVEATVALEIAFGDAGEASAVIRALVADAGRLAGEATP